MKFYDYVLRILRFQITDWDSKNPQSEICNPQSKEEAYEKGT
jgi:hypothetical protein